MKEFTTLAAVVPAAIVEEAWQEVGASFERFCLTAGIATLANMMEEDAARLCGPRYGRAEGKDGHRWGKTKGKVGFHGGKVEIERPRVRAREGGEIALPSWETALSEDLLGKWALNLMLINVSTAQVRPRRPPAGRRCACAQGHRRVQIGGIAPVRGAVGGAHGGMDGGRPVRAGPADHPDRRHPHRGGPDAAGRRRHRRRRREASARRDRGGHRERRRGAGASGQPGRAGLDPTVCRLFIIDGAKALSKAIRKTFGRHTPIQRCQVHKARNITERLAKPLHASVRKALRQAWELDDAEKAEKLISNLARRLEQEAPGVSASILEGIDEILTVTRLGLPVELRRSLACTNIIENMNGTIRQVCRNVKRWQDAKMALRWTAPPCWRPPRVSGGSRPTSNCRSCGPPWLPIRPSTPATPTLNSTPRPHSLLNQRCLPSEFQHGAGHPLSGCRWGRVRWITISAINRTVTR